MADMREPYAYVDGEADKYEVKARAAREEIIRLTAIAETYEQMSLSLRHAVHEQLEADANRELENSK